jgi:hypothetical protein
MIMGQHLVSMPALICNIAFIILSFVNGASAANYRCEKTSYVALPFHDSAIRIAP